MLFVQRHCWCFIGAVEIILWEDRWLEYELMIHLSSVTNDDQAQIKVQIRFWRCYKVYLASALASLKV